VVNPDDFWIGYVYGFGEGFISPVTYTNGTGTYNIYEQLFEEFEPYNEDYTYSTSYEYSGATVDVAITEIVEFSLKGDVFAFYQKDSISVTIVGGGYDDHILETVEYEMTINTVTGLLGVSVLDIEVDSSYGSGALHMKIDSGYANTPYEWAFSFLGLTVIAAVVGLAKRKR
ncbi:MAG: hypothetical protein ACTSQF_10990, partial [Candidatus Heimdallarchaeaceae archaeon]